MATNELLPFANGEDANVLPIAQWQALTDILENGFQSGIARSEQVNRVLAQGAVASYVLGQLIVDQLNKDATLDKNALYQNIVKALQENAKDACLPLSGGNVTGNLTVQGKNVLRSVNGVNADASGNVTLTGDYVTETWESSDGKSWYRKWSDGWIEQGGNAYTPKGASGEPNILTFPLAFSDANYTFTCTGSSKNASYEGDWYVVWSSKTNTNIGISTRFYYCDWYACGY